MLRSLPQVEVTGIAVEQYDPTAVFDLYVFDGWLPAALPPGHWLLIDPPTGQELVPVIGALGSGSALGENLQAPRIAYTQPSPLLRFVELSGVQVYIARRLSVPDWAEPVVGAREGPLILAGYPGIEGQRAVVFAFELNPISTNLVNRSVFPVLMANVLDWLSGTSGTRTTGISGGEALLIDPLPRATRVRIVTPGERVYEFDGHERFRFVDTFAPGSYLVSQFAAGELIAQERYLVGQIPAGESDLRPRSAVIALAAASTTVVAPRPPSRSSRNGGAGWHWQCWDCLRWNGGGITVPDLFTHPQWLGLVALVPLFVWLLRRRPARRSGHTIGRVERWTPLVPRLLVILLLILALAGLKLPAPPQSTATVFVIDQSASIPNDIQAATRSWVEGALGTAGPDDLAGIVTFDKTARVELPLGKHREHSAWRVPNGGEGTDLEAALRLAAALLPPAESGPLRRIVLLTDGNETQGSAEAALLRPELRGIEIAVWSLPPPLLDPALTALTAPPAAREGEPLEVRIGTSTAQEVTGRLRLWANDQVIADDTVTLEPGPREYVVTREGLPAGFYGLRATLEVDEDRREQNNEVAGFTVVSPAAHVLLVEGQAGEGAAVQQALSAAQITTQLIRSRANCRRARRS